MSITPNQMLAARRLLRWTQLQLAYEPGASQGTVAHIETNRRRPSERIISAVKKALEDAGVGFTAGDAGVWLGKEKARR